MPQQGQNPGSLDRRIALLRCAASLDTVGSPTEVFLYYGLVWAQWMPTSTAEPVGGQAKRGQLMGMFRIRYNASVDATWRILMGGVAFELMGPPMEVGRFNYQDLVVRSVPDSFFNSPTLVAFEILLNEGDISADVVYPPIFAQTPAALYLQLVLPDDTSESFQLDIRDISADSTGFHVDFGASVPGPGYRLNVQVSNTGGLLQSTSDQSVQRFNVVIAAGDTFADIDYPFEFATPPTGLTVTLLLPNPDADDFTVSPVSVTRTNAGCTVVFGAVVPADGYQLSILASI